MKKNLLSLFTICALSAMLWSCDKKKEDPKPAVEKGCLLTTFVMNDEPNFPVKFFYDNDRKLSQIEVSSEIIDGTEDALITPEYNANKQITKVSYAAKSTPSFVDYYYELAYNAAGLMTKKTHFYRDEPNQPFESQGYYTYEYNANKQVIKITDFAEDGNYYDYIILTYDSKGNVQKEEDYRKVGSAFELDDITIYEYDDKPNALGMVFNYLSDDGDGAVTLSKNNITKQINTYPATGRTETYVSTYEYNQQGMVTKVDNGDGEIFILTYNCN